MKIYTKTGDKGETGLLGGKRVSKNCVEMQVIGELDELNAALGVVLVSLRGSNCHPERALKGDEGSLSQFLQSIQRDLFKIGAELASLQMSQTVIPSDSLPRECGEESLSKNKDRDPSHSFGMTIGQSNITELEHQIDTLWTKLPELKSFILPGGSLAGAHLHLARAVCRRAERCLVAFGRSLKSEVRSPKSSLRPEINMYLNRLSDFLFVAARWVNFKNGAKEIKV